MKKEHPVNRTNLLAQERTLLSNERTMLAHLRTSFSAFILGVALLQFFRDGITTYLGLLCIILGIFFLGVGIVYYPLRNQRIKEI